MLTPILSGLFDRFCGENRIELLWLTFFRFSFFRRPWFPMAVGGAREDRTPDLLRARQALSQLSYGPNSGVPNKFRVVHPAALWIARLLARIESGLGGCSRAKPFGSAALGSTAFFLALVGLGGVEPPTSPLSGVRSNQLSYRPRCVFQSK